MLSELKLGTKILSTNLGLFNPYELNFAVTYMCNSRCKTCGIWKVKPKNEMTLNEIKKFVKKIKFIHWVRLTGGEPFLRKDYVEIVKTFDKNLDLFLLSTPTNGTMPELVYEKVKRILRFFKKRYIISVSLDGPKKIHNKIKGIKCWEKAINTYEKLKEIEKNNFKVFFGYTISPYNVGYLEKTIDDIKEILPETGLKDFHINLFHTSDVYYQNKKTKLKKDFVKKAIKELELCINERRNYLNPIDMVQLSYLKMSKKYLKTKKCPLNCNIYNISCFVNPFGDVYPCTLLNQKLGNLRKEKYDLKKILSSKKSKSIMKEIKNSNCPHCWTPCEAHQMILSNWLKL